MKKDTLFPQLVGKLIIRRDNQPLGLEIIAAGDMDAKIAASLVKIYLADQLPQGAYLGFGFNKYSHIALSASGVNKHISRTKYKVPLIFESEFPSPGQNFWGNGKIENLCQNLGDILINPKHQSIMCGRFEVFIEKTKSLLEALCFRCCHNDPKRCG